MSGGWILKTEPTAYSFDRLATEKRAVWDGVSNPVALRNLREMAVGDPVLIYHTGDEKAAVGLARVARAAYRDPKQNDPKLVVVDVECVRPLKQHVTLKAVKADPAFADFALVRMGRLSVVPATAAQWKRLMAMAGEH
ncbi:MAG TPA: EVE domain-containing protein [Gemmatimonadales bacterium]|nr:EVE domain-containing protein [Gemmatimonadales bacterium]